MSALRVPSNLPLEVAVSLAREHVRSGRAFRVRTRGGSMRPLIPAGSVLSVHTIDDAQLSPGDVVLFAQPAGPDGQWRWVAHRLLRRPDVRGGGAITKGDRSPHPERGVPAEHVIGRVHSLSLPTGRVRTLSSPAARLLGLGLALASPWLGFAESLRRQRLAFF